MKKFNHAIVYVGNRLSGKVSRHLLIKLKKMRINGVKFFRAVTLDDAKSRIKKLNDDPFYAKVHIFVLYCEDLDKTNRKGLNPELAINVEIFVNSMSNRSKFVLHHKYELGMLFGNKIETNRAFTALGINCPEIITSKDYNGPVFVNDVCGSRSPVAGVIPNAQNMDPSKYNTQLIDTSYEYQGKTYYINPRVFSFGKQITHFVIKSISADKGDRVVRTPWDVTYDEAPGLQYDFFKTQIIPTYAEIQEICNKIYARYGLNAYCFDLLRDVKNEKWYVSEIMFKFDSAGSVRRSHYSVITYRQIAKDIHNKIYSEDKMLADLEYIPPELMNSTYLPREVYHKKVAAVHYWIQKFIAKEFSSEFENAKLEAIKNGAWED